ncbi:MAG TPA: hypothetical protein VK213_00245 [Bacteroidales bacterium]|nr:hypothetical protein [Bacteroidales bacterium]
MLNTEPVKNSKEATNLALRIIIIITLIGALGIGYIAISLSGNITDGLTAAAFVLILGLFVLIFGRYYDK